MATAEINTPVDDLKDLFWVTQERLGYALDQLGGRGVDLEADEWAFDEVQEAAVKALAKHVPGVSYGGNGLPLYETPDAFRAARTYDDGTPVVETINFADIDGITFQYRPRHDKPREEFMAWARQEAEKYQADQHARYVGVGGIGVQYIGDPDEEFHAHIHMDDGEAFTSLTRAQVTELRDGLTRVLATQVLELEADGECDPQSR